MINTTKNQHYISQVEQRLNSRNPNARIENQEILSFNIIDRERYQIHKSSEKPSKIAASLALNDLYSFDCLNKAERLNFENAFHPYEKSIRRVSESIINSVISNEEIDTPSLKSLFGFKMLNFLRNPYCINKAIDTFGDAANFEPTNGEFNKIYRKIIYGKKPHQTYLCDKLGIDGEKYKAWLRTIYMLLTKFPGMTSNCFDLYIDAQFSSKDIVKNVMINVYDSIHHTCLLSDRGFNEVTNEANGFAFEFNIASNAVVIFQFMDALNFFNSIAVPDNFLSRMEFCHNINVMTARNNIDHLKSYNSRTIRQCYRNVYSSNENIETLQI